MRPHRPYLIRALIDWIVDNGWTPHLLIAADVDGVEVPRDHVQDGRIVLNISARAVRGFVCADDAVSFDSRFGGRPFHVVAPMAGVVAVYARENGAGLAFQGSHVSGGFAAAAPATDAAGTNPSASPTGRREETPPDSRRPPRAKRGGPKLTVID